MNDSENQADCLGNDIISCEPWWARPPAPGQTEADLDWGWLIIYRDGRVRFDGTSRPTDDEIERRPGCRLFNEGDSLDPQE